MSIKANVKGKLGHARGTNSKILNPKSLLLLSRFHKWITNVREVMVDVIPGKRGVRLFCGSILLLARTLQAESPLQYVGHSFHLKRRLNFKSIQKVSENLI